MMLCGRPGVSSWASVLTTKSLLSTSYDHDSISVHGSDSIWLEILNSSGEIFQRLDAARRQEYIWEYLNRSWPLACASTWTYAGKCEPCELFHVQHWLVWCFCHECSGDPQLIHSSPGCWFPFLKVSVARRSNRSWEDTTLSQRRSPKTS